MVLGRARCGCGGPEVFLGVWRDNTLTVETQSTQYAEKGRGNALLDGRKSRSLPAAGRPRCARDDSAFSFLRKN